MLDPITTALSLTPASIILAKGACKAVTRIGDLLLAGPENRARYQKALWEAKTQKDKDSLHAGECVFDGKKSVPFVLPDIRSPCIWKQVEQAEEMQNLAGCLNFALDAGKDMPDGEVSDESVDRAWFARWRKEAQGVSNEEVQRLWGTILAEEVKKPSSFSLRTLDVLRNLSCADVELFCRMRRYFVNTIFPYYSNIVPKPFGYDDIIRMVEAGIFMSPTPQGHRGVDRGEYVLLDAHDLYLHCIGDSRHVKDRAAIVGIGVSRAGEELQRIGDIPPMNRDIFNEIAHIMHINSNANMKFLKKMSAHPKNDDDTYNMDRVVFEYTFS